MDEETTEHLSDSLDTKPLVSNTDSNGERYDVALICLSGHVVNDSINERPLRNKDFCSLCGKKTISKCQGCEGTIQGCYHHPHNGYVEVHQAPAFCPKCGKPFPWTQDRLDAIGELADLFESLSDDDRESLKHGASDLICNTPYAPVAAQKLKLILKKIGKEGADVVKTILTDAISETARKILFGQ